MSAKSFEDTLSLSDLKADPDSVLEHLKESRRPVLLTSRGRSVAVVRSLRGYEADEEERRFMRAVVAGLADVEAGRELSLADAKARLGLG